MNAMIADDHPLARIAIRNLFNTNGVAVITGLDNGDRVAQTVRKTKPKLLIIDASIPSISDVEVLEQLRRRRYTGIIIITSAKNGFSYGKHNAEYGANGFVSKEEGMGNILAAIEAAKSGYSCFPFPLEHFTGSSVSKQDRLDTLSNQEMRVLRYILNGMDYSTVASKMSISSKTVSTYKSRLMKELDCSSLVEIYDYAQRSKIG